MAARHAAQTKKAKAAEAGKAKAAAKASGDAAKLDAARVEAHRRLARLARARTKSLGDALRAVQRALPAVGEHLREEVYAGVLAGLLALNEHSTLRTGSCADEPATEVTTPIELGANRGFTPGQLLSFYEAAYRSGDYELAAKIERILLETLAAGITHEDVIGERGLEYQREIGPSSSEAAEAARRELLHWQARTASDADSTTALVLIEQGMGIHSAVRLVFGLSSDEVAVSKERQRVQYALAPQVMSDEETAEWDKVIAEKMAGEESLKETALKEQAPRNQGTPRR